MSETPIIEVRDLKRHVSGLDRPLLDISRWSLHAGDRVGLRGPTGSGKSSLLRAFALLDPWASGELRFRGSELDPESTPEYRRSVIYLPQRPALTPPTVRDSLTLPFEFSGVNVANAEARTFREDVALRWLEPFERGRAFLDKPTDTLSGGERQIVSLVRAIQLQPQVLLLDEPTASLDVDSAGRWEQAMMTWHGEASTGASNRESGRAFVIASHHPDQLERLSERVVTINRGMIEEAVDDD